MDGTAKGAGGRRFRPGVERCEARIQMSAAATAAVHAQVAHVAQRSFAAEVARYRVFEGTIPLGHGRVLSVRGPILLGPTDGRGQVIGALYPTDGSPRIGVVGLLFGGEVSLQLTMPNGRKLYASGSGELRRVVGGYPGYDALMGRGNLRVAGGSGPLGHWDTIKAG